MEERLKEYFLHARREGSPDTVRERVMRNLHSHFLPRSSNSPDYVLARGEGLTISEAEHALALAEDIKNYGLDTMLARLEMHPHPPRKTFVKKRRRPPVDDSDLKKKTKR
mmetsp:Transcript_84/g.141  ORF Transcript_84/g.141 Transcript_84/m.141 type:complete len:110 (-) Transcript_84:94-423(-)